MTRREPQEGKAGMKKNWLGLTVRELEDALRQKMPPGNLRLGFFDGSWTAEAMMETRSEHGLPRLQLRTFRAPTLGEALVQILEAA